MAERKLVFRASLTFLEMFSLLGSKSLWIHLELRLGVGSKGLSAECGPGSGCVGHSACRRVVRAGAGLGSPRPALLQTGAGRGRRPWMLLAS